MSLTGNHRYSVSGARGALALGLLGCFLGAGLAPTPVTAGSDPATVDFGIALMPSSLTIPQGTHGSTSVNLVPPTQIGGGSGGYALPSSVALSISGLPSGVTADRLGSLGPRSSSTTLALSVSASAPTGQFTVTVTGTASGQTRTSQLTLTVAQAVTNDFNITSSASLTIVRGSYAGSGVGLWATGSIPTGVKLTVSGLPSGVTSGVIPFGAGDNDLSASVSFGVGSTAALGSTLVTLTATYGNIVRTTTIYLQVVAYPSQLWLMAWPVTVAQGGVASTRVFTSAGNGPITYAIVGLPAGVTANLDPVTVDGGTTVNLSASSTTATGITAVTVIGTSGPVVETANLVLTITPANPTADFSIAPSAPTLDIAQGSSAWGEMYATTTGAFSGTVSLSVSGLPSGVTASLEQFSSISGAGGAATVKFTASSSAATGPHAVTFTGTSGGVSRTTTLTLNVRSPSPAFTLSGGGSTLSLTRGATFTFDVWSTWTTGSGALTYSLTGLPSGVTATFSPQSSSDGTNITLSASSSAPIGTWGITINGTSSNGDVATTCFQLAVNPAPAPDFAVFANPTTVNVVQSSGAVANVNLARIGGFTGDVSLSVSGLPSDVSASITPFRASDSGSLATATVTFNAGNSAATSQYTVTITGTSGGLTHSATISLSVLSVESFSILPRSSELQIVPGAQTSVFLSISVTADVGSGSITPATFTISGLPSGVTGSFNPVTSTFGTTLTLQASSAAAPGTSTLTITATTTAGTVRSAVVKLTVATATDTTPPSVPANPVWSADGMTVTLSWQPSTDDVAVVGYDLYYGSFFLGTFADPQLSLIGFKAGTPYVFTVKARDAAGNVSSASSPMTVLLSAPKDTTPPTAPTNVAATSVSSTRVSLSWTASKDDVGVVVYQLSVNGKISGTVMSPSVTITNLTPSTSYSVTVTALDAAGNVSQASTSLTVKTTAS